MTLSAAETDFKILVVLHTVLQSSNGMSVRINLLFCFSEKEKGDFV